jgi:hypothetical protein
VKCLALQLVVGVRRPVKQVFSLVGSNHLLALLVLLLTAVWLVLFTDYFPLVGNLLGLTGVLAVIPALSGLLPDDYRDRYRKLINKGLFGNRVATLVYVVALVSIFGLFLGAKPFELEYQESGPTRKIEIMFADGSARTVRLSPLSARRFPVWGLPWETPVARVRTSGLPNRLVPVRYFETELAVPDDLWGEPVVLVLPAIADLPDIASRGMTLELRAEGPDPKSARVIRIEAYTGWAIWLGTGEPLETPASLRARLQTMERNVVMAMADESSKDRLKLASTVFRWSEPMLSGITRLLPSDKVTVTLKSRGSGCVMGESAVQLGQVTRFPVVKEIRYDHTCRP